MYHYVYFLRSIPNPDKIYIGLTSDLEERLKMHHDGYGADHTRTFRPWKLELFVGFENRQKAIDFERYLKSGSGMAFAKKRLWDSDEFDS